MFMDTNNSHTFNAYAKAYFIGNKKGSLILSQPINNLTRETSKNI